MHICILYFIYFNKHYIAHLYKCREVFLFFFSRHVCHLFITMHDSIDPLVIHCKVSVCFCPLQCNSSHSCKLSMWSQLTFSCRNVSFLLPLVDTKLLSKSICHIVWIETLIPACCHFGKLCSVSNPNLFGTWPLVQTGLFWTPWSLNCLMKICFWLT